ncbi:unnamed protein product [Mucor circinelloides]
MIFQQEQDIYCQHNQHCSQCSNKPTMSNSTSQTTYLSTRKNRKSITKKLNHILKSLLIPCYHHANKRKKNTCKGNKNASLATVAVSVQDKEQYGCCGCQSARDSVTIVDGPEQPWIVPSEYHKNMSESVSSASGSNHWMFRTGWTPQPDPLAFLNSGWCVNCNACIRRDQKQCSFCDASPLITSDHQIPMRNIKEMDETN